jgi:tRNA threonylcarbamoyladenosine biosynthesis protein TsaE
LVTNHYTLTTRSAEETRRVGRLLGESCRGGEVLLLEGDLGAGKTTLTQGVAAGLGVTASVISPTFILLREYEGRLPLYHFDFYRLEGTGRAVDLEFGEYLGAGGVCVIEWPAFAPEVAPPEYLRVELRISGETSRTLILEAVGRRHEELLGRLEAALTPNPSPCGGRGETAYAPSPLEGEGATG